ncbi:uncharacterized protein LOC124278464 [Haliotis rubra]|uniref:uncharacterized protein LOC124278464 n=1 Tax=Haliotis rubra TaxID=36100 RepID=UPI001EE5E8BB|nr:uncharacterized protein LOC124278464 [Haliotis rubra]
MAYVSNLVPKFNGTGNARQWLKKMDCLRQHQSLSDSVYLNLLPLYLDGPAATWLDSLHPAPTTAAQFEAVFTRRFTDVTSQTAFLSARQNNTESGPAFIERVQEKTVGLQIPETLLVQVIINGLQPPLKGLVIPHGPQSLEALSHQVRLAEATLQATQGATPSISSVTSTGVDNSQLATIAALLTTQQQQLDKLTAQMAHVPQRQNVNRYVSRDPPHQPRVNTRRFAQPLQQQQRQQQPRSSYRQPSGKRHISNILCILIVVIFQPLLASPLALEDSVLRVNYGIAFTPSKDTTDFSQDKKDHLSLSRLVQRAKNRKIAFTNLAEPILDGSAIPVASWPNLNSILALIALTLACASTLAFVYTFQRIRTISTLLILLQTKSHGSHIAPTATPPTVTHIGQATWLSLTFATMMRCKELSR